MGYTIPKAKGLPNQKTYSAVDQLVQDPVFRTPCFKGWSLYGSDPPNFLSKLNEQHSQHCGSA